MSVKLLTDAELHDSPVVANSTMNRQRVATGVNSYARELPFDPLDFLSHLPPPVAWLDLCCGEGRAILEGARYFRDRIGYAGSVFCGVDLVDGFAAVQADESAEFIVSSLPGFETPRQFDLITCIHGLHYIGDKLQVIADAATWLKPGGVLLASFDPQSIFDAQYQSLSRKVLQQLRKNNFEYAPRQHLLRCNSGANFNTTWSYLGASDAAGPNYTGQPAVHSYYSTLGRAGT